MSQPLARSAVRVVLIEDHALFAESLELALSLEGYDVRRAPMPRSASRPLQRSPRSFGCDLGSCSSTSTSGRAGTASG